MDVPDPHLYLLPQYTHMSHTRILSIQELFFFLHYFQDNQADQSEMSSTLQ